MPSPSCQLTAICLFGSLLSGCVTTRQPGHDPIAEKQAVSASTPVPHQSRRPIGSALVRHGCIYYTQTAGGKMAQGGSLPKGKRVTIYKRTTDGWAEVSLGDGRIVSVPSEDLVTAAQFSKDARRASEARRTAFPDPRPKLDPAAAAGTRLGSRLLPAPGPPPEDFIPPPLPEAATEPSPLEEGPSILFPDKKE